MVPWRLAYIWPGSMTEALAEVNRQAVEDLNYPYLDFRVYPVYLDELDRAWYIRNFV